MPRCLVALGSNLGDRRQTIADAVALLQASGAVTRLKASSPIETAPVGGPEGQSAFVNAAVTFETELAPEALFDLLQHVERQLDRERRERWGARSVDLDLLLYGDAIIDSPLLEVPHPRMAFRRFVLGPAAEVAGEMLHPTTGWTVAELLGRLGTTARYVAILGLAGPAKAELARQLAQRGGGRFLADPAGISPEFARSDPSSRDPARSIEFLDARAKALDVACWPDREELVVSDFYLDECLAFANVDLDAEHALSVTRHWQAVRDQVVSPRLLVVLTPPRAGLTAGSRELELTDEFVRLAARHRVVTPSMVNPLDREAALDEIAAAVEAMR